MHYWDTTVGVHEFVHVAFTEQVFIEHCLCERGVLNVNSISKLQESIDAFWTFTTWFCFYHWTSQTSAKNDLTQYYFLLQNLGILTQLTEHLKYMCIFMHMYTHMYINTYKYMIYLDSPR